MKGLTIRHVLLPSLVLIVTLITSAGAAKGRDRQGADARSIVGDWVLVAKREPNEKRAVTFSVKQNRIEGFYVTADGKKETITRAKLDQARLSFQIPTLQLTFDLSRTPAGFEGVVLQRGRDHKTTRTDRVHMIRRGNR